jgi:outer membrane protein assembly factor BamB
MFGKVLVGLTAAGVLAGSVATGAMAAPAATAAATPAPKQQAAKDRFGGIVTAINETQVTVKNPKAGSKTFLRNSDTVVMKAGQKSSWSEIEVNSHVLVRYQDKGGKLYATRVRIGRAHIAGTVQSINGNTITMRTRDGKDVRLTVTSNTKYFKVAGKKQRQPGSLSDIHTGIRLLAAGSYDSSHNFDAALIAYRAK